jgi:hypothetical protein
MIVLGKFLPRRGYTSHPQHLVSYLVLHSGAIPEIPG